MPNRIYLIVADDTEEFGNALRYACKAARANNTHIGVLNIIPDSDFVNWGNIEERIKEDRRREAEKLLDTIAEKIKSMITIALPANSSALSRPSFSSASE